MLYFFVISCQLCFFDRTSVLLGIMKLVLPTDCFLLSLLISFTSFLPCPFSFFSFFAAHFLVNIDKPFDPLHPKTKKNTQYQCSACLSDHYYESSPQLWLWQLVHVSCSAFFFSSSSSHLIACCS